MKPKFSVVLPVHNKGNYVTDAIASVVAQSVTDFELIVVDDASSDDSLIKIRRFEDERMRVLKRDIPGPGGYAARNLALEYAKGEWIAFLDADDEWYPDHLSVLAHIIEVSNASGFIATGWDIMDLNGELRSCAFSRKYGRYELVSLSFNDYLYNVSEGTTPVHTNTVAVEAGLIHRIGGFPENRCTRSGDTATWLRLAACANGLAVAPATTARYNYCYSDVIRTTAPQVEDNCTVATVRSLLSSSLPKRTVRLLKKVSNTRSQHALLRRASVGTLDLKSCSKHYPSVGLSVHCVLIAVALLPAAVQKWIVSRVVYRFVRPMNAKR